MAAFEITIGDNIYKGETASAADQLQALHIACNSNLVLALKGEEEDMSLVIILMRLEWDQLNQLEALLLRDKVTRDGLPVARNMFRDNIQEYCLLLGRAAQKNLANFYSLRSGAEKAAAETDQ